MFFQQIYEPGLAHASYMVGCQATGQVMVIDAKRDIDTYLDIARREQLTITHLVETHIHADFLSGTRELAAVTGATMLLSDEGGEEWQYAFDHQGLHDGDRFMIGNIAVDVVHTPGHTPEHVSFLVTDTPTTPNIPIMMFTGDFVFVGDVGRPDLLEKAAGYEGTMEVGARQMWASLQRFRALPDHIQVHPAHGAGSACGKALGAIPSSTVGYEKLVNWALRHTDEDAFVAELLSGQPEPPYYFAEMKRRNKQERPLLTSVPVPPTLTPDAVATLLDAGRIVIDARGKAAFAAGHIPATINIQNNKSFSTWAGWTVPYDQPFGLVCPASEVDDVVRKLMRIGLDDVAGVLPDVAAWSAAGRPLAAMAKVDNEQLAALDGQPDVVVIDVRARSEYRDGHIPGTRHHHGGTLPRHHDDLPRTGTLVLTCQTGNRSSTVVSALMRLGFTNVVDHAPGYAGWIGERRPVERATGEVA